MSKEKTKEISPEEAEQTRQSLVKSWEALILEEDPDREAVCKLAKQGIPKSIRSKIWGWLLKIDQCKAEHPTAFEDAKAGEPEARIRYVIDSDIVRTFPGDRRFHLGKELSIRLQTVLYAYAVHDKLVKYTQGMNSVAAMLVMNVESDEDVFWMLDRLCNSEFLNLARLYGPGLKLVSEIIYIFEILLRRYQPETYHRCRSVSRALKLPSGVVGYIIPKLFFPLFTSLPLPVACRIWDVMLAEGLPFLYQVCLFVLSRMNMHMVRTRSSTHDQFQKWMESVHVVPKVDKIFEDPDQVIQLASGFHPDKKELKALEQMFENEEHRKFTPQKFLVNNKSMLRVESFPSVRLLEHSEKKRSMDSPKSETGNGSPLMGNPGLKAPKSPLLSSFATHGSSFLASPDSLLPTPEAKAGFFSSKPPLKPRNPPRNSRDRKEMAAGSLGLPRPQSYAGAMNSVATTFYRPFTNNSNISSSRVRSDLNRPVNNKPKRQNNHFFRTSHSSVNTERIHNLSPSGVPRPGFGLKSVKSDSSFRKKYSTGLFALPEPIESLLPEKPPPASLDERKCAMKATGRRRSQQRMAKIKPKGSILDL
mmetsp:Transcript_23774/g.33271  ORF Transcript_23774/g.33271 Transcript_23774/m.33271 type:complete len:589 (-) Transcript_23774:221-1987(-)|eukprot:CAMPEP_0184499218 /NCGR_PEP_ID=MMETSP0113_2-20130426/40925_1 /TAXON_ID=91329 /ORGANISM="Norrisiella sphaerica, Strain BC52" /LENGTH=588 /DNA_ID=CAMNT_0026887053 /DNA_START=191 /DNA_END=1957 /DNA_ORIENTATION=+